MVGTSILGSWNSHWQTVRKKSDKLGTTIWEENIPPGWLQAPKYEAQPGSSLVHEHFDPENTLWLTNIAIENGHL